MKMDRRVFIQLVGFNAAAYALGRPAASKKSKKPNIIYINIDDMGWKDVTYMGSRFYETPNIDKLASEGIIFTNAYAPAANCAPSRACCMSGQYGPRHGIYTVTSSERGDAKTRKLIPTKNETILPDDNVTIAEALKAGGYTSITLGKWHLGPDPRTQGFDENVGGNTAGHPPSYFSPYKNKSLPDGPKGEHLPYRLTDEALDFIERNASKPFFMYFPFYSIHGPIQTTQELANKYEAKGGDDLHDNAKYAGMIESVDTNIGRLIAKLNELNLTDNTFILFTSDNGGVNGVTSQEPLRAGKGSYYEGGIRVPMFVKWPSKIKPGSKSDTPVSGIDFYPTLLEVTGTSKPKGKLLDGISIVPVITGKGDLPERPLYWHFPIYLQKYIGNDSTRDPIFRTRPGSVIRLGNWKLHEYFEDGGIELYNLKDDISENHELSEKYPQKAKELLDMLKAWRKKTGAPVPTELNPKYDEAYDLKLRSQGKQSKNKKS
jgi:arylsulfatase A-like enzyme